jgi:DNA polymerase-3 subunit gamma/tau
MELYKKYRPKKLEDIIGQDAAIDMLQRKLKKGNIPHTILLTGPSGCGKTTIGRILKKRLRCRGFDFIEINGADKGGIEDTRRMKKVPMNTKSKCKIWLIDEAHKITSAAQDMLLKPLEDTPKHVYFILASSEPKKLKAAIRNRCTEIKVKPLSSIDMKKLILDIGKKEKIKKLPGKVLDKIIEAADGSARKALVFLDAVMDMDKESNMIEAIKAATAEVAGFAIAQALHKKISWKVMQNLLISAKGEDPESIRWIVLGYANSVLLGTWGDHAKAFRVIEAFQAHFYDCKFAGVIAACYDVITGED